SGGWTRGRQEGATEIRGVSGLKPGAGLGNRARTVGIISTSGQRDQGRGGGRERGCARRGRRCRGWCGGPVLLASGGPGRTSAAAARLPGAQWGGDDALDLVGRHAAVEHL